MTREELLLVQLAGALAQGGDERLDSAIGAVVAAKVDPLMVEEGILMGIVAVGFPRTLIAMRAWRKAGGHQPSAIGHQPKADSSTSAASRQKPAAEELSPSPGSDYRRHEEWTSSGEATCKIVYGANYERLRETVRQLHPDLDGWMITEGYGRTLSRPGLTLRQRELLMMAMCAVSDVPHQLHSHLKGALHAGATVAEVGEALEAVIGGVSAREQEQARQLFRRVGG